MQPILANEPFSNPEWLFEPKWDGYRALCYYPELKFIPRNGRELNFPELKFKLKYFCVLDGEIVAIDQDGKPCFDELRRKTRTCAIVYYVVRSIVSQR